jgi:Xaa-Pro aminopeptidase
MGVAKMIYDISEKNADLFYISGFRAPDAFLFFETHGKKYMVMTDLEIDRAKKESRVDRVLSINTYVKLAEKHVKRANRADVIHEVLKERKVRKLIVPGDTSFVLVDALRKKGYKITSGPNPFYEERLTKSKEELRDIETTQRAVFAAMGLARDVLKTSRIKGSRLIYRGKTLTSEMLKTIIQVFLLEHGFTASDTIVACGRHAIDPHDHGAGPLTPHASIIIDMYPHSNKTFYFGDATRTFCRGRAPDKLREMYDIVREAQAMGIKMVRAGVNGKKIHTSIQKFFEAKGYPTGIERGRNQGFFHGTGHGVGLEIHEEPVRINQRNFILKKGHVVSVEPGLYYSDIGGVRIEDLVHVTGAGCEVLAKFPKQLEIL